MNKFLKKLGVSSSFDLVDVYALDDDVLNTIPEAKAVIMLFPVSGKLPREKFLAMPMPLST